MRCTFINARTDNGIPFAPVWRKREHLMTREELDQRDSDQQINEESPDTAQQEAWALAI